MRKSKFAKRHYEAIAQVMQTQEMVWIGNDMQIADTAYALAKMFQDDNPRFDKERFIAACQPGANVKARRPRIRDTHLAHNQKRNAA